MTVPVKKSKPDARKLAHHMLNRLFLKNLSLEEVWETTPELGQLETRDRAHCRLLLLTLLRQLGYLDQRIGHYAKTPDKLPPEVRNALRLGAVQLLILQTPAHAVVSTSVDLIGGKNTAMRGLVNGVLRNMVRDMEAVPNAAINPTDHWQSAIPAWLLQSWATTYGKALSERIAKACLGEPTLDLTVKGDAAKWAVDLGATLLPTGSLRLAHQEDVTRLKGFAEGAWWVQDVAATLPVLLAGDVRGKTVLDLCAAPGGKTAQLVNAGADVTAVDVSPERLKRLHENLQRLHLQATVVAADAFHYKPATPVDLVLLDAPCSATGTLRRHPDLMHHKKQADIIRLAAMQKNLLTHCSNFVKKGGMLIYAVCSLQAEECAAVVEAFLASNKTWKRLPVKPQELGQHPDLAAEWVTKAGDLRTLPCFLNESGGMDGFYAARLTKTE